MTALAVLAALVILWIVPPFVSHSIGRAKGFDNPWLWGFALGWIGVMVVAGKAPRPAAASGAARAPNYRHAATNDSERAASTPPSNATWALRIRVLGADEGGLDPGSGAHVLVQELKSIGFEPRRPARSASQARLHRLGLETGGELGFETDGEAI